MSEEEEDIVVIPDVDAIFLLVAGGAEGGARPRCFREEGVITQRTWRKKRSKRKTRKKKREGKREFRFKILLEIQNLKNLFK